MTSSRSYIINALYCWIVDNECTPHLLINTRYPGVNVPSQFHADDQVILNLAPLAIRDLEISLEAVAFTARFSSKAFNVYLPIPAVLAIYTKESGKGMVFEDEEVDDKRVEFPSLASIKGMNDSKKKNDDADGPSGSDNTPPPKKGRPSLKIIK